MKFSLYNHPLHFLSKHIALTFQVRTLFIKFEFFFITEKLSQTNKIDLGELEQTDALTHTTRTVSQCLQNYLLL